MSFSAARESRIWHAPRIVGACRISKRLDGWLGRLAVDRDRHGAANWTEGLKNSRTPEGVLRPRVKDPRGGHAPASGRFARIRHLEAKVNIFLREFTFPHAVVSDSCAGAPRRPRRRGSRRRHRGGKRRCDQVEAHEASSFFQGGGMLENESGASPKEGPAAQELQPLGVFSAEPPRRFSSPLGQKPMGGFAAYTELSGRLQALLANLEPLRVCLRVAAGRTLFRRAAAAADASGLARVLISRPDRVTRRQPRLAGWRRRLRTRAGPPRRKAPQPKSCSPWGYSQQNLRGGSATRRIRNPPGGL